MELSDFVTIIRRIPFEDSIEEVKKLVVLPKTMSGKVSLWNRKLRISGLFKRKVDEQAFIRDFISFASGLNHERREATIIYKTECLPIEFIRQLQQDPASVFWNYNQVTFTGTYKAVNSEKFPQGYEYHPAIYHLIGFRLHLKPPRGLPRRLELDAGGNYRLHLKRLADMLTPPVYGLIHLSREDGQKLLKSIRRRKQFSSLVEELEKRLKHPREDMLFVFDCHKKDHYTRERSLELKVAIENVGSIEEALEKRLIMAPQEQESYLVHFFRDYRGFISRREIIRDMQIMLGEIPGIDLGIQYDTPLLTYDETKELLDREIEYIKGLLDGTKHYPTMWPHEDFYARTDILSRIASEHFGWDIERTIKDLTDRSPDNYLDYLISLGYKPQDMFENWQNHKHLFEFFFRSYLKDPKSSIEHYRTHYINKNRPDFKVVVHGAKDIADIKRISLPRDHTISKFGIYPRGRDTDNSLEVDRWPSFYENKPAEYHFGLNTKIDNPLLLRLQEYAYKRLGVTFLPCPLHLLN